MSNIAEDVLTQYYRIDLKIDITFLCKKIIIFLDPFLCNFVRLKTWVKDIIESHKSIMFNKHTLWLCKRCMVGYILIMD